MRTRSRPEAADVIQRRLDQLRVELASQWQSPDPEPTEPEAWWDPHTRLPPEPETTTDEPAPEPVPEPEVAAVSASRPALAASVPTPGRHASRRRLGLPIDVLAPVRGRVALSPWHLALVAVGVAVALAVTCWWVIRSDPSTQSTAPLATSQPLASLPVMPQSITTPGAVATPTASGSAGPVGSVGPAASTTKVTVDVEGKVRRPGIAVLPTGSRVVDAIRAAGGAPHRKDLSGLNLAAVLTDGQQIVVGGPTTGAPGATPGSSTGSAPGSAAPSGAPGTLVNLNTATLEQLDTLPDIGPVTAQSILDWRQQNGGFTSVDELDEVDGIGPVTVQKLTPLVTV